MPKEVIHIRNHKTKAIMFTRPLMAGENAWEVLRTLSHQEVGLKDEEKEFELTTDPPPTKAENAKP